MRADRLIQIVLLLQKRHTMSARDLAEELNVSRRTIFRDMDALGTLGIPVYADQGSEGGYRLVEGYRSSLNALTRDELSALLAFSFPEPLADLGIGQKVKTALLKLFVTVAPNQHRIHLDWTQRGVGHEPVPHLQKLYQATCEDRTIAIRYRLFGRIEIESEVEPYGLIAKAGVWYVVYAGNGRVRHRRASELTEVSVLDKPFVRPPDFDLENYWKTLSAESERESGRFKAVLRVSPVIYRRLPHLLGQGVYPLPQQAEADDWVRAELCFESFEAARTQILALGGAVEVLEPLALRLSVQDFAAQILQLY